MIFLFFKIGVFSLVFWPLMAGGEEYVTVIEREDQHVSGEIKQNPWSEGIKLTYDRVKLHVVAKAQQICTSRGMKWFQKGVKFEVVPPPPEDPKGYKITYLQCISYYSDNTKILLGLKKLPALEEYEIVPSLSANVEKTFEEPNLGLNLQGHQLNLASCEELNQVLLAFSPQKYVAATLQGVFLEDNSLKEQLTKLSDTFHRDGWKLDQGVSQVAIYRATMMEKMLDELLPISVLDPSEQALNVTLRRGIDACLGTTWDENGIWAKAIATLPKKNVPDNLCGRLKTLVQARQRIKIAEEKFEEATAKNDLTAKWLEWLSNSQLAAPLAVNVLDSAILAVINNIIHHEKLPHKSALKPEVISAINLLEMSVEAGVKADNFEFCGVKWPLKESDIERTEEEKIIGAVAATVKTYRDIVQLADKGKKKKEGFTLLSVVPLVDLPEHEKEEYLGKEKAYLLTNLYKKADGQLDDDGLNPENRSRLTEAALKRIKEVIRAYSNTSSEAALMAKEWLEFLELSKGKS